MENLTVQINTSLAEESFGDSTISKAHYIYVMGGRHRGKTFGSVERYHVEENRWEVQPSMRENRGSHGAASIGTSVIVIGGGGFKSNLSTVERFDHHEGVWIDVAPMTTHRHALVVQEFESYIYAIGGWVDGSQCTSAVEKYDIHRNQWTSCSSLLFPRRLHGAAALTSARKIFTFGGNSKEGEWYSSTVESYDIDTNEWTQLKNLPFTGPCSATTIVDINGKETMFIFMHGACVLKYSEDDDSYIRLSKLPLPEWYCFDVVTLNLNIFVIGGAVKGKWSNALYRYDTSNDAWEALPCMNK